MKWGPTSANSSPARFLFVRSQKAKERLRPVLASGNAEKTMKASVTVIIAYDLKFYGKLPKLFPHNPAMRNVFVDNPQLVEVTARRNSSLQGAYFMLARVRWDSTVAPCRVLTMQGSMRSSSAPANAKTANRSSSPKVTSSRTSCAISGSATGQSASPAVHAWNSAKPARCCERIR